MSLKDFTQNPNNEDNEDIEEREVLLNEENRQSAVSEMGIIFF